MKILKQHATVKSIGGIVLLLLVFFASVSVIGYNSFTEALMSQYSEGAFLTAETAAQMTEWMNMQKAEALHRNIRISWNSWTICAIPPDRHLFM